MVIQKTNELVSVIIPIYNSEKVLYRCLESIIKQTFTNIEIILVNDGSLDDSLSIIKKFANKDQRIKVINQKNAGVSAARNAGIEASNGNFITFIDADDYVEVNYIEELYDTLYKYNADICLCTELEEMPNGKILVKKIDDTKEEYLPKIFSINAGYSYINDNCKDKVWGAIYKRTVIGDIRFVTDLFVGEDSLFFAQVAKNSKNIVRIYKQLYHYVIYENSAVHGTFDEKKYTELESWKRICKLFIDIQDIYYSAKCKYAISCRGLIVNHYKNKDFKSKYYPIVFKEYKRNIKYFWKASGVPFHKKMWCIGFLLSPPFYIGMRNLREKCK